MRLRNKISIAASSAFLISAAAPNGCDGQVGSSKYSSEEEGYVFSNAGTYSKACQIGTTQVVSDGVMILGTDVNGGAQFVPQTRQVKIMNFAGISDIFTEARRFNNHLPPDVFSNAKISLSDAMSYEISGQYNQAQLEQRYMTACQRYRDAVAQIASRSETFNTSDSVYVEFQPRVGPTVGFDSQSGFYANMSLSIPTKFGDLSVGYKNDGGVKYLVIVNEGQQRTLILDRPFEFLVPQGYSTRISFSGDDTLYIYVDS